MTFLTAAVLTAASGLLPPNKTRHATSIALPQAEDPVSKRFKRYRDAWLTAGTEWDERSIQFFCDTPDNHLDYDLHYVTVPQRGGKPAIAAVLNVQLDHGFNRSYSSLPEVYETKEGARKGAIDRASKEGLFASILTLCVAYPPAPSSSPGRPETPADFGKVLGLPAKLVASANNLDLINNEVKWIARQLGATLSYHTLESDHHKELFGDTEHGAVIVMSTPASGEKKSRSWTWTAPPQWLTVVEARVAVSFLVFQQAQSVLESDCSYYVPTDYLKPVLKFREASTDPNGSGEEAMPYVDGEFLNLSGQYRQEQIWGK